VFVQVERRGGWNAASWSSNYGQNPPLDTRVPEKAREKQRRGGGGREEADAAALCISHQLKHKQTRRELAQGQEQGNNGGQGVTVAKALTKENVTTNVALQDLQGEVKRLQNLMFAEGG